jgi:ribosome-associated toxin RatA of RatAB toxin-antitoxin module
MTTIQRSALVPYPAQVLFDLVNAIETYPQFMDGCAAATVIERTNEFVEARLDLAKGGLRYSFTTRNQLTPPQRIDMTLVEGPFSKFHGVWTFHPLGEQACKISLHLEFELSGRLLNFAARKMFDSVANQMVDALVKRAHQLHGRTS